MWNKWFLRRKQDDEKGEIQAECAPKTEGFSDGQSASLLVPSESSGRPTSKIGMFAVLLVGCAGMLLLLLPSCWQNTAVSEPVSSETVDLADYAQYWEKQTRSLVTAITGDSEPTVVVTLAQSREYVYEYETEVVADGERNSSEKTVARYENDSGRDRALLRTTLEPRAAGVVVVCRNGDEISVRSRVIGAVATALGLSTDKVFVTAKNTAAS